VDDKINVKLGYNETHLSFPLKYLYPMTTNERPRFISEADAQPVVECKGYRVVVIGSDLTSNQDLVGNYGKVDRFHRDFAGRAQVAISSPGPYNGQKFVFREEALCASYDRTVVWDDSLIA
jgi:hypothetical protein